MWVCSYDSLPKLYSFHRTILTISSQSVFFFFFFFYCFSLLWNLIQTHWKSVIFVVDLRDTAAKGSCGREKENPLNWGVAKLGWFLCHLPNKIPWNLQHQHQLHSSADASTTAKPRCHEQTQQPSATPTATLKSLERIRTQSCNKKVVPQVSVHV